jgi:hypothetical protein
VRLVVLLGSLVLASLPLQAQGLPLRSMAERTRATWQAQNARELVNQSSQLTLQLPQANPSAPVSRDQAAELLRDFFNRSDEVVTGVTDVRETTGGLGLVELRRLFRVRGTQDVLEQRVLLTYRASGGGWMLVELRIATP